MPKASLLFKKVCKIYKNNKTVLKLYLFTKIYEEKHPSKRYDTNPVYNYTDTNIYTPIIGFSILLNTIMLFITMLKLFK